MEKASLGDAKARDRKQGHVHCPQGESLGPVNCPVEGQLDIFLTKEKVTPLQPPHEE